MQFKDIAGQEDTINRLTAAIDSGRVSHAQMVLGGPEAALPLAWAYMQYLCCPHHVHPADGGLRADSCGECPSCKKIASLMHPDLHWIFPNPPNGSSSVSAEDYQADFRRFLLERGGKGSLDEWHSFLGTDIKTSMIRELDAAHIVQTLSMKPYEGGWRMLIVWMPTKMNASAANELLKTLEEPLPQTLIMLVDESTEGLLPTIRSRVQTLTLRGAERDAVQAGREEYAPLLVAWLRMLFKLRMKELGGQVDRMSALNREQQKQFLQYASAVMRECFLSTAAGLPCHLESGDPKFDAQFPNMITPNNIETIEHVLDEALMAIERNANAKIALMELSFRMSKALKKR